MDHVQSHLTTVATIPTFRDNHAHVPLATFRPHAQPGSDATALAPLRSSTSAVAQRLAHTAEGCSAQIFTSIGMTLALVVIATSCRLISPLAGLWLLVGASLAYLNALLIFRQAQRHWKKAFLAACLPSVETR